MEYVVAKPLPQRQRRKKNVQAKLLTPAVVQLPVQSVSNKTEKNRRKRQRKRANRRALVPVEYREDLAPIVSPSLEQPLSTVFMPQPRGVSYQGKAIGVRNYLDKSLKGAKLTKEGMDFLKCAFAAPDFDGNANVGFTDDFCGNSLSIKSRYTNTLNIKGGNDYYIVLLPIPGVAYALSAQPAGTPFTAGANLSCTLYSNFNSLFGPPIVDNATDEIVNKFRFVSNHFELICNSNNNTWSGNIAVFKLPLQATIKSVGVMAATAMTIEGLRGLNATDQARYDGPSNLGCYTGAFNKGAEYDFSPIWQHQTNLPNFLDPTDFGQILGPAGGSFPVPGFDNNFETTCIKITGVTADMSMQVKTWSCVEYQFQAGSVMYESQVLKCVHDQFALDLYRRIIYELPIAVSSFDNARFWERVLNIIRSVSGMLAVLPGQYGMAARGVNLLSESIAQMVL